MIRWPRSVSPRTLSWLRLSRIHETIPQTLFYCKSQVWRSVLTVCFRRFLAAYRPVFAESSTVRRGPPQAEQRYNDHQMDYSYAPRASGSNYSTASSTDYYEPMNSPQGNGRPSHGERSSRFARSVCLVLHRRFILFLEVACCSSNKLFSWFASRLCRCKTNCCFMYKYCTSLH